MTIVDILIILMLIVYILKGFSNGAIRELVTFVGGIAVIIISFLIKNPLSVFLYEQLPFFKFSGILSGISVLNIIVYELLSFIIIATILMLIYKLIVKVSNIIETILNFTIILGIPSKIIGAIVGAIEGIFVIFILVFISAQISSIKPYIEESKYSNTILTKTPILSNSVEPIRKSMDEIYELAERYKDSADKESVNLQALDILLKYKVLDVENARNLKDSGKLNINNIDSVLEKYENVK